MRFARLPVVSVTEAGGYFRRYVLEIRKKALYNDVRVSASLFLAPLKEICDRNVRRVVGGLARECLYTVIFNVL